MVAGIAKVSRRLMVLFAALVLVAACSQDDGPRLLNLEAANDGPDEFGILPNKPLQTPESLAGLPAPTPGGANRADPTPRADMIAALGGRPSVLNRSGGDGGLVSYATRFGVAPGIRSQLATEDLEFRKRNDGRLLERIFNVNVYFRAYEPFELDQHRELERFRAAGIRTPAAPPEVAQ